MVAATDLQHDIGSMGPLFGQHCLGVMSEQWCVGWWCWWWWGGVACSVSGWSRLGRQDREVEAKWGSSAIGGTHYCALCFPCAQFSRAQSYLHELPPNAPPPIGRVHRQLQYLELIRGHPPPHHPPHHGVSDSVGMLRQSFCTAATARGYQDNGTLALELLLHMAAWHVPQVGLGRMGGVGRSTNGHGTGASPAHSPRSAAVSTARRAHSRYLLTRADHRAQLP
jgi:hypothetical protein